MWDFCLVNSSQSFLWNASLCLSLSLYRSLSLFSHARTHASDTSRSQCCMFPALSGPLQIILKSVDLTKALINGVLLALFLAHFQECWILSPSCRKKSGGEGSERKWQRERGERQRFFSSLAVVKRELAERLEVLRDRCFLFKALSPAEERNVASVEFMRPSRRAPLKSFVIPYTHMHTGQLTHTHTHTHLWKALWCHRSVHLSISLVSISPTSFLLSCVKLCSFFFWTEKSAVMNWVNNQFLWTF